VLELKHKMAQVNLASVELASGQQIESLIIGLLSANKNITLGSQSIALVCRGSKDFDGETRYVSLPACAAALERLQATKQIRFKDFRGYGVNRAPEDYEAHKAHNPGETC